MPNGEGVLAVDATGADDVYGIDNSAGIDSQLTVRDDLGCSTFSCPDL